MPSIPLPQATNIERADWAAPGLNTGGFAQLPDNARTPVNPLDAANSMAAQQAQTQLNQVKAGSEINDIQNKQRSMQLSMLSGILNEPDPDKQRALISSLVPVANKLNPSYQIDPNTDVGTIRALVQSQVSPEKTAELQYQRANAQMLAGIKSEQILKDPADGQYYRYNKLTGDKQPVSAQDAMQYQATGGLPQASDTGIFQQLNQPNPGQGGGAASQLPPQMQQPPQPTFGFPVETNLNQVKTQQGVDSKRMTAFITNQQKADNALHLLDSLDANINSFKTGAGAGLGGMGDKLLSATGLASDDTNRKATQYDNINSNTNDLVTQLQGFQSAPGQRGTLLGLQTLIGSKPSVSNTTASNLSTTAKYRGEINDYLTTEELAQAYQQANPLKVVNEANVNALDSALKKKFPLTSIDKDGNTVFNAQNVDAIRQEIPDAIANPKNYLGKKSAASAPSGAPDNAKQAPDGKWYSPDPTRPGKYLQW